MTKGWEHDTVKNLILAMSRWYLHPFIYVILFVCNDFIHPSLNLYKPYHLLVPIVLIRRSSTIKSRDSTRELIHPSSSRMWGKRAWRTTLALRRIIVGIRASPHINIAARSLPSGCPPFQLKKLIDRVFETSNNPSTANIALYSHAWPRYKHLEPILLEDIMIDLCALNDPEHISFS